MPAMPTHRRSHLASGKFDAVCCVCARARAQRIRTTCSQLGQACSCMFRAHVVDLLLLCMSWPLARCCASTAAVASAMWTATLMASLTAKTGAALTPPSRRRVCAGVGSATMMLTATRRRTVTTAVSVMVPSRRPARGEWCVWCGSMPSSERVYVWWTRACALWWGRGVCLACLCLSVAVCGSTWEWSACMCVCGAGGGGMMLARGGG